MVQELPKYLLVAGSPEKLKRARPRGNDLCWLLSGLARSARSAQGRPSFGQWEGGGREKLRYTQRSCGRGELRESRSKLKTAMAGRDSRERESLVEGEAGARGVSELERSWVLF